MKFFKNILVHSLTSFWRLGIFCSVVSFFVSCSNDACKEPMNSTMQIQFYYKPNKVLWALPDTFSIYAVKDGEMLPTVYVDTAGLYQVSLPLDPSDTVSRFYFRTSTIRDTFVVHHVNTNEFVSAECGARNVSSIDTFYFGRGRFDDSISVVNPSVNGYNKTNVQIYFE